ncbi:hypothetical protein [Aliiroseovarius halocynthiae]|uniref:Uncharacterized protein n=2 Tax=Aliiroseovarius halocynthiae TaxID=985055 RepID=A0A545SVV2_9RHOB|nr:hypothetical protein [Aliiroseovarius halocynthiae]TQV69098.1 hypothetical protein FIL88_05890 [Aliiroseovarius halocynthiae]
MWQLDANCGIIVIIFYRPESLLAALNLKSIALRGVKMLVKKKVLIALAMAGAVWGGTTQSAHAQKYCNLATAKLSLDPAILCECKIVTTQMLRYIQRQDEFLFVLEKVTDQCPAFANALNALPTATAPDRVKRDKEDDDEPARTPKPIQPRKPDPKPKVDPKPGGGGDPDDKPKPKPGDKPKPKPGDKPKPSDDGDTPGDKPKPEDGGGEKPKPKNGDDTPGDKPNPEGNEGETPGDKPNPEGGEGDNPSAEGGGDTPGDKPQPKEGGDTPGDKPASEGGCSGGGSEGGSSAQNAGSGSGEGC